MDRKRKEEREGGREGGGEEGKDREREEGRKRRKCSQFSLICSYSSASMWKVLETARVSLQPVKINVDLEGESCGLQLQRFSCCLITKSCSKFNMSPDSHLILTAGRQDLSSQICFPTILTNLPFNNLFSPGKWSLTKL